MPAKPTRRTPPTAEQIDLFEQAPTRAFTVNEFLTEIGREIEMRRWVDKKNIAAGRMSISAANEKMNCLQSLMSFLRACDERQIETEGDLF